MDFIGHFESLSEDTSTRVDVSTWPCLRHVSTDLVWDITARKIKVMWH